MTGGDKIRAETCGRAGDCRATLVLYPKGFTIAAHRLRTPDGEIDLVATRGSTVAIVEVKARAQALEALSPSQRLARTPGWLKASLSAFATMAVWFDLILISPWKWHRHITGA